MFHLKMLTLPDQHFTHSFHQTFPTQSKDIVLRVIAAGLAPDNCSVVRVMTPHPDTALPSTSILDALKKMHGMDEQIVGVPYVLILIMGANTIICCIFRWPLPQLACIG